eukprot:175026-Chlamydomonas_euryale.AAC.1
MGVDAPPDVAAAPWRDAYAGPACGARVEGLAPNTAYALRARASNGAGPGEWSEQLDTATARLPPGPPCGVAVCSASCDGDVAPAAGGDAWVELSWSAPHAADDRAAAVSFEVAATPAAGNSGGAADAAVAAGATVRSTVGRGARSMRLAGLASGTMYAVRMRSVGAEGAGHGEWSDAIV